MLPLPADLALGQGMQAAQLQVLQLGCHRWAAAGQRLRCRHHHQLLHPARRSLRGGHEGAQRLDLVAKPLDANRRPLRGREDVHDAPPVRHLTGLGDHGHRLVAQALQPVQERRDPHQIAHPEQTGVGGQRRRRQGDGEQPADRGHDHRRRFGPGVARAPAVQAGQGLQPQLATGRVPRDALIGQRVGRREEVDALGLGQVGPERLRLGPGVVRLAGQPQHRCPEGSGQGRDNGRAGGLGQPQRAHRAPGLATGDANDQLPKTGVVAHGIQQASQRELAHGWGMAAGGGREANRQR